jgi:hypothetical protein
VDTSKKLTADAGWHALHSVGAMVGRRPLPHWHDMGIHRVTPSPGDQRFEIVLDPGAWKWLAVGDDDAIDVRLGTAGQRASDTGPDTPAVVHRGDERLGVLGADADAIYRPILAEARHEDVVVVTTAIRSRTADDAWRLRVGSPGKGLDGLLGRF